MLDYMFQWDTIIGDKISNIGYQDFIPQIAVPTCMYYICYVYTVHQCENLDIEIFVHFPFVLYLILD